MSTVNATVTKKSAFSKPANVNAADFAKANAILAKLDERKGAKPTTTVKPPVVAVTVKPAAAKAPKAAEPGSLASLPIVAKPSKPGDYMGGGKFFLPGARPTEQAIRSAVSAMLVDGAKLKQARLSEDGSRIDCRIHAGNDEDFWGLSRDKDAQSIGYTEDAPGQYVLDRAAWASLDPSGFLRAENAAKEAKEAARAKRAADVAAAKAAIEAAKPKAPPVAAKPATKATTKGPKPTEPIKPIKKAKSAFKKTA